MKHMLSLLIFAMMLIFICSFSFQQTQSDNSLLISSKLSNDFQWNTTLPASTNFIIEGTKITTKTSSWYQVVSSKPLPLVSTTTFHLLKQYQPGWFIQIGFITAEYQIIIDHFCARGYNRGAMEYGFRNFHGWIDSNGKQVEDMNEKLAVQQGERLRLTVDRNNMVWSWENLDSGYVGNFVLDPYYKNLDAYIYVCMAQTSHTYPNSIEIVNDL